LFANIHKLRLQPIALVTEAEPKIDEMDTAQNWKNYILCSSEEKLAILSVVRVYSHFINVTVRILICLYQILIQLIKWKI